MTSKNHIKFLILLLGLCTPILCQAATTHDGSPFDFNALQEFIINVAFAVGAAFLAAGIRTIYLASDRPDRYNYTSGFITTITGCLIFSITYIACDLSRSFVVQNPLNLDTIAINYQLANMSYNSTAGIYKVLSPNIVKNIIGGIMGIGWGALVYAFYHLKMAGDSEKGHISKFFTRLLCATVAMNITHVGAFLASIFPFLKS